ncbi:high affinity copper uptake protein 1-like [Littorina saxatilis]|uniref:Copper transport protein n=1 Tax=Littorina saxatilis TaxID=31220 RepID=A0AAN9AXK0_9CAEN
MDTYFFTRVNISNLLFEDLNINNTKELVGACAIIFIATVIFEAIKTVKVYISLRLNENPLAGVQNLQEPHSLEVTPRSHDDVILLSSLHFPVTVRQIRIRKIGLHILDSLVQMVNFFYGYLLMLVVMTYSVWLTVAVIVGCGAGYFIFGAIGQTLQLRYQSTQRSHMTSSPEDHHQTPQVQACAGHL